MNGCGTLKSLCLNCGGTGFHCVAFDTVRVVGYALNPVA